MIEGARADLKQRGIKDADKAPIPAEIFVPQAERRVRLGLVVAELVRANNLQAKPEQLQAHIEETVAELREAGRSAALVPVSDRSRMAEVEAIVVENNVTDFVLAKAKVTDKELPFDSLIDGLIRRRRPAPGASCARQRPPGQRQTPGSAGRCLLCLPGCNAVNHRHLQRWGRARRDIMVDTDPSSYGKELLHERT